MRETEGEVLARIESTRARMGETIEQIGDRVNPDRVQAEIKARARQQVRDAKTNMKHKAKDAMRDIEHGVSDAGRGLWDAIRENPIPAGMVGVGLAWLIANQATGRDDHDLEYGVYPRDRYTGRTGYVGARGELADAEYGSRPVGYAVPMDGESDDASRMDEAKERVSEAKDRVKDKASEAAHEVRDKASHLAHRASEEMDDMQDRARHAVRDAGQRVRRAEHRVEHAVQDNPLAAGAIAAALGFAAGMMVPETRREHEMFGPTRDRMVDKAESKVRKVGAKARDVAKDTASEAARKAVDEMTGNGGGASEPTRERAGVTEPGR